MTGRHFRKDNGEHHQALNHTLKTMERNQNIYMKRNHGVQSSKSSPMKGIFYHSKSVINTFLDIIDEQIVDYHHPCILITGRPHTST